MPFLSRYSAVSARRARRLVVEFGGTQKANSGPGGAAGVLARVAGRPVSQPPGEAFFGSAGDGAGTPRRAASADVR